ncbi:MAG: ComEA family DNA-binding protein [Dethiobacter sp.]|jgi:competence protein ComEA|nr:MAG: ComEA family DNA-binding protein [Dethiobacter sp.]
MFKLTPKEQKLLILLVCLLVLGFVLRFALPEQETALIKKTAETGIKDNSSGADEEKESFTPENEVIIVHVTGAVKTPGVYTLEKGSRVFQVVDKAGGALDDADLERINLAQHLYDGQPVFVPRKGDESPPPHAGTTSYESFSAGIHKININTAGKSQLETLPGIGSVKAQNIINYREKNGPFQSIEDLVKVSGIGDKTLEGLRDLITVY